MTSTPSMLPADLTSLKEIALARRAFLESFVGAGVATLLLPSSAFATNEVWEEGDPLCNVPHKTLDEPYGYQLDAELLKDFISLSQSLTGIARLDPHLANQYMERYATFPHLSKNLGALINAYRAIMGSSGLPSDADVNDKIFKSSDAVIRFSAKQLIYLWYVSAFYLSNPLDPDPNPSKPPLQDEPAGTPPTQIKRAWVYGTPEQYRRALLWQIVRAHAPMTSGGKPGHWAERPVA